MYTKTSNNLYFSPPIADWYFWNDIDEVKACRSVWGSLLNTYPQPFVLHCYEAMGGTVHVLKLEKAELIDEDIHQEQECSLARQLKNSTRKLASGYSCLKRKHDF